MQEKVTLYAAKGLPQIARDRKGRKLNKCLVLFDLARSDSYNFRRRIMNAIRRSDNAKRPRRKATLVGALLAVLVGIAGAQTASPVDQVHPRPAAHRHHWYEFGLASWYGKFFQGRTTASGEPYNQDAMTCAQRNLPLGSLLRVTNLRNNRSVVVRVNDRGPVPQDRVIDLSRAAAERLGFSREGVAPVRIELIQTGSERPTTVAELNQAPATR